MKGIPDVSSIRTDTVSFDIFDTLVLRPFVEPTDLFLLLEQQFDIPGFAVKRMGAERDARSRSKKEVTLDDIYSHIPEYKEMMARECDAEISLAQPNPGMVSLLKDLTARDKMIILISDMYLPKKTVESMLDKVGVHYDLLYLSSEIGSTKHTGELFSYVLQDLSLKPADLTHIGDNRHSDLKVPRSMGINTIFAERPVSAYLRTHDNERRYYRKNRCLSSSIIVAMDMLSELNNKNSDDSVWKRMGLRYGGPLAFSFVNFIHSKARKDSVLFFTARDGYSLKRVYEYLFPDENDCHYVNLQRVIYNSLFDSRLPVDNDIILPTKVTHIIRYGRVVSRIRSILSFFSDDLNIDKIPTDAMELTGKYNLLRASIKSSRENETSLLMTELKGLCGDKDVDLIDCTTMRYTSQKLLESLISKEVHGIYLVTLKDSTNSNDSMCRWKGRIGWLKVNTSEFLLCSPELPLKGLCDGRPIYMECPDPEVERAEHYDEVSEGIISYCRFFKDIFGDIMPMMEYNPVTEWMLLVTAHGTEYRDLLSRMKWASNSDHTDWISLFPMRQPLKSIKRLIDDVLGRLFPEK